MRNPQPIPLRAPFGGLKTSPPMRTIAPRDASVLLNVHTRDGAIEKRRGFTGFSATTLAGAIDLIKPVRIGGVNYLYAYTLNKRHTLLDVNGNIVFTLDASAIHPNGLRPTPIVANDILYVPNDTPANSRKIYLDGSTWVSARMGIEQPATAPNRQAFLGTGLYPAGSTQTVSYRFTWYNSVAVIESGPSKEGGNSNPDGVTELGMKIRCQGTGDAQVDKIRLYRQNKTTNDPTWYLITTLNNPGAASTVDYDDEGGTTVFEDDVTKSDFLSRIPLYGAVPPTTHIHAWYANRMFYADDDVKGRVRYSELYEPERASPLWILNFGEEDGDDLLGMVESGRVLYVFKQNSIWGMTGRDKPTFIPQRLIDNVGGISQHAIVPVGNAVFFASNYGIQRLVSGVVDPVAMTDEVDNIFREWAADSRVNICGAYAQRQRLLIWTGKRATSDEYDQQLVYDLRRDNWFVWNLPATSVCSFSRTFGGTPQLHFAIGTAGAPNARRIGVYGGPDGNENKDAGETDIAYEWSSGQTDFGTAYLKHFSYMTVEWQRLTGVVDTLAVDIAINGEVFAEIGTIDLTRSDATAKLPIGRRGHLIRWRLRGVSGNRVRITGVHFDVEVIGSR